ncbi:DUF1642 domain-containing protein [Streptococcus sp.]
MNKQEAIEKIKSEKILGGINSYGLGYNEALDEAIYIVRQLDGPEKPVVPQYVADMIVKRKRAGQSVIKAIENLRFYEDACKWVRNNGEAFVKAWLFGYEVEKEKKYTVELPNPHDNSHTILYKNPNGNISIEYDYDDDWYTGNCYQLTEAEIKKDFDWAWQFAEEVEE